MHYMHDSPNRHVPARTNEGWPIAAAVVGLAILCAAWAGYMYKTTYKHPTDTTWRAAGAEAPAAH